MSNLETINKKIKKLSPELQMELDKFIDFLLSQNNKKNSPQKLKQDWGGGLKDLKEKYTSVELQKLAMEWRMK